MTKLKFKPQQRGDSCGVACINYILKMEGYDFEEEELYAMGFQAGGMDDDEVVKMLGKFKIKADAFRIKRDSLLEWLNSGSRDYLISTVWSKKDEQWHYVIIQHADDESVYLLDPDGDVAPRVYRRMTREKFFEYLNSDRVEMIIVDVGRKNGTSRRG